MNCTVRRRFNARTAREGAIRIAGAIDIVGSLSGVRCTVDYQQSKCVRFQSQSDSIMWKASS